MYINCIFLEYYQAVISNILVCIPVVMLNDNYMRRSMVNKKTSRISTTCGSDYDSKLPIVLFV